jgi:hypothetical protein
MIFSKKEAKEELIRFIPTLKKHNPFYDEGYIDSLLNRISGDVVEISRGNHSVYIIGDGNQLIDQLFFEL